MPRKRIKGRARKVTAESQLRLTIEKTNTKIRRLEKQGNFGHWASKQLLEYVSDKNVPIKLTGRKGKKKLKVLKAVNQLSKRQTSMINKKIKSISAQKTFSNAGIKEVDDKIRIKVEKTLGRRIDNKVDVEKFFEINKHYKDSKLQAISPSDLYVLVENAKSIDASEDDWIKILSDYQSINLEETRKEAKRLYQKYIVN